MAGQEGHAHTSCKALEMLISEQPAPAHPSFHPPRPQEDRPSRLLSTGGYGVCGPPQTAVAACGRASPARSPGKGLEQWSKWHPAWPSRASWGLGACLGLPFMSAPSGTPGWWSGCERWAVSAPSPRLQKGFSPGGCFKEGLGRSEVCGVAPHLGPSCPWVAEMP